jgi:amino acid transporter
MERSAPTPPVERTASTPPEDRGLRREAIGLREVFFQSVTHMAPAAAVAFSMIVGANFASGALPFSVVFALVGCLLVAISIGQLAKHLPSAGGFYTYTARGIHPVDRVPGGLGLSASRLWLGAQYNSPFTAFAILGTIIGAVVIAIHMAVNLACLLFYARERRSEFNVFLHAVIPILGSSRSCRPPWSLSAWGGPCSTSSASSRTRSVSSGPWSASVTRSGSCI